MSLNYSYIGFRRSLREDQWVLPDVDNGGQPNTSLSVFYQGFHLLIDAGNGIEESIKKGCSGQISSRCDLDYSCETTAHK